MPPVLGIQRPSGKLEPVSAVEPDFGCFTVRGSTNKANWKGCWSHLTKSFEGVNHQLEKIGWWNGPTRSFHNKCGSANCEKLETNAEVCLAEICWMPLVLPLDPFLGEPCLSTYYDILYVYLRYAGFSTQQWIGLHHLASSFPTFQLFAMGFRTKNQSRFHFTKFNGLKGKTFFFF